MVIDELIGGGEARERFRERFRVDFEGLMGRLGVPAERDGLFRGRCAVSGECSSRGGWLGMSQPGGCSATGMSRLRFGVVAGAPGSGFAEGEGVEDDGGPDR